MAKRNMESGDPIGAAEALLQERQSIASENTEETLPDNKPETEAKPPAEPERPAQEEQPEGTESFLQSSTVKQAPPALILTGAASFMSHGIKFHKGKPVPVSDEGLFRALKKTGFFREG